MTASALIIRSAAYMGCQGDAQPNDFFSLRGKGVLVWQHFVFLVLVKILHHQ